MALYQAGDERDEAAWLCGRLSAIRRGGRLGDAAVLYRTNAQSRALEEALVRAGLPYRVYGGMRFYERKEVKDLVAYLRAVVNPKDDMAVARIINEPRRGIGDATVELLRAQAAAEGTPLFTAVLFPERLSTRAAAAVEGFATLMSELSDIHRTIKPDEFLRRLIDRTGYEKQFAKDDDENADRLANIRELEAAMRDYMDREPEGGLAGFLENVALVTDLDSMDEQDRGVTLMTLHSAKGLEFDDVFITGMEEGIFPTMRATYDDDKLEEERRLCYVGITRAKKRLHLSLARTRALYNERRAGEPSRFLSEIPANLVEDASLRRGPDRLPPARAVAPTRAASPAVTRIQPMDIPGVKRGAAAFVPS
ncbi:MAG: ATP-binding domain-containing protein, partial [Clostridiales bacterium]|nr:ATP-binding domain-containing protein [Clostridiales bacterium]